jgi:hypothetical protein
MPTKIETHLTADEFTALCEEVFSTPGGTRLKEIQRIAEKHGVRVSLTGAANFVGGPFQNYLADLRARRELAEQVNGAAEGGFALSDAAASILTQKILDQALALDAGDEELLGKSNDLSLALSRLRSGDQRAKLLQAQLDKLKREKTEWEDARAKAKAALQAAAKPAAQGITAETLKQVAEAIKLL